MSERPPTYDNRRRFSTEHLLAWITLVLMLAGQLALTSYNYGQTAARVSSLEHQVDELNTTVRELLLKR